MRTFRQFLLEFSRLPPEIRTHLEGLGYRFWGSGVDQAAYLEPKTGKILKIFGAASRQSVKNAAGFSRDHLMFKRWVQFCEQNHSNEFLPRFDGWESFELDGEKYLQIRMERLKKLPAKLGHLLSLFARDAASKHHDAWKARWKNLVGDTDLNGFLEDSLEELVLLIGEEGFEKLWGTLVRIGEIGQKNGYTNDLHEGNFMHRNDGTPVIVDPWVIRG